MSEIKIAYSDDGLFLDTASTLRVGALRRDHVRMRRIDAAGDASERRYYPLIVRGEPMLADVVTGALYDAQSGVCLSSRTLRIAVATGDVPIAVKPRRKRSSKAAREAAGWMNDARRAA